MLNKLLSEKERDILNLLLKGERSLPEITDRLGISKPATIKHLNEMENIGLVDSEMITTKVGRIKMFRIRPYSVSLSIDPKRGGMIYQNNEPVYLDNPLVGQIKQERFRAAVKTYLENITGEMKIDLAVVLYGSIARGEGTSKSDIDLLFLSKNEWKEKEINIIMDALHKGAIETQIQVKPLFWVVKDFMNKRDNLTKRIKNEGMILFDRTMDDELWISMKRYWNIRG
jgi:predicted transcriptional regulator